MPSPGRISRSIGVILGLAIALGSTLTTVSATDEVIIRDDAHVLSAVDQQAIRAAAQAAGFAAVALTVDGGYSSNQIGFIQFAQSAVPDNAVVVAVDPRDRYSHIAARPDTGLSAAELRTVHMAADQVAASSGWGAGMVAALHDLALLDPAKSPPFPWTLAVSGALLVIVVVFLGWRLVRRRPRSGGPELLGAA